MVSIPRRKIMDNGEHRTEPADAAVVSLTLSVLSTLLVRAGEPADRKDISLELDDTTVWLATNLVDRMASIAAPMRSKSLTAAHLEEFLAGLGLKAIYRSGCVCMELGSQSRTCGCHALLRAHV
jgi:hypothetical protein